jgi:hypothetical protein
VYVGVLGDAGEDLELQRAREGGLVRRDVELGQVRREHILCPRVRWGGPPMQNNWGEGDIETRRRKVILFK